MTRGNPGVRPAPSLLWVVRQGPGSGEHPHGSSRNSSSSIGHTRLAPSGNSRFPTSIACLTLDNNLLAPRIHRRKANS
ncbi:hypothetical protein E2C01_045692 [Portunus trituberculatus]|uniref:Uncharacterized protein n=1 Tax=Portunus trituberculatus TaxID=210409 RepID=A0A5B7G2Q7_PORTR|nr:hypothetical protein [Portunus trituberculatus]